MFGAAGYRGREGEVLLSICKVIRADEPDAVIATQQSLSSETPPMMRNHKAQIAQLDYELSKENMPIKQATEAAEANMNSVAASAAKATQTATSAATAAFCWLCYCRLHARLCA